MFLHGIAFIKLSQPRTRTANLRQIYADLFPPRPAKIIILDRDVTMSGGSIKSGGSDRASVELHAENGKHRVIDESPQGVAQRLVLVETEEAHEFVEETIRLFQLQVEAESLEKQILMMQNRVPPFPELLRLLVYEQVGLFLGDSATGDHDLSHPPNILLDLRCEKQRRGSYWIGVHARPLRYIDHAVSHEEPVEVHGSGCDGKLGQFQHDAHLRNEIHALAPTSALRFELHAVQLGRCPRNLVIREKPLRLAREQDGVRRCGNRPRHGRVQRWRRHLVMLSSKAIQRWTKCGTEGKEGADDQGFVFTRLDRGRQLSEAHCARDPTTSRPQKAIYVLC